MNRTALIGSSLVLLLTTIISLAKSADERFSPYVDSHGAISLPEDFRTSLNHLGSWYVPDGPASGFHDVYTEASTIEAYRDTGRFPDGALLVKEFRSAKAGVYTTGVGVSYATGAVNQWFVMIKDAKGRFPNNPGWGDGWGWALVPPTDRTANMTTNYKIDCLGCHLPAQATDWVYVEAYPTLH